MASITPIHSYGSPQFRKTCRNSFGTWCARKTWTHAAYNLLRSQPHHLNHDGCGTDNLGRTKSMYRFLPTYFTSVFLTYSSRQPSSIMSSVVSFDYDYGESLPPLDINGDDVTNTSCIGYLLQILHESARIISIALQYHESSRNYPKLAKAWVGVDVDAWKRHIAYQAAAYALLKAVMEIGNMFDDNHPVYDILSPKISLILESLQGLLSKRDPKLVKWFRMEQQSVLTKCLNAILERWASYVKRGHIRAAHVWLPCIRVLAFLVSSSIVVQNEEGLLITKHFSDIAVIILAISCCIAIRKLDAGRISCPTFTLSLRDTIWELVHSSPGFASVDILHHLATKSGYENELLNHFGPKVLHHDARGNIIFWMGLLQEKLVAAFFRESVVPNLQIFCHTEVVAGDLAVIGLFAFLGRKTRLFLSLMGIKDLDEPVKDFICYLECGILFLYPELSSISVYQLFLEVVSEEIGWLDLYAEVPCTRHQERKRLKHHAIQAEKEIILSTVFGVCSDMFSSFAHYTEKTEQSLDVNLTAYLHGCKNLLTFCLEDYWAAYDRLRELEKTMQVQFPEPVTHTGNLVTVIASLSLKECHQRPGDLMTKGITECTPQHMLEISKSSCSDKILEKLPEAVETKLHQSLFAKSSSCLLSTTSDIWMGTRLLYVDLRVTIGLIQKQIFGHTLTKRERKKIARTVTEIVCVVPIVILMLLPVTAIGHAAILTAIKKYITRLIPSPYSTERLDVIKQLKRAKKMKVQSCSNPNVTSPAL